MTSRDESAERAVRQRRITPAAPCCRSFLLCFNNDEVSSFFVCERGSEKKQLCGQVNVDDEPVIAGLEHISLRSPADTIRTEEMFWCFYETTWFVIISLYFGTLSF